VVLDTEEINLPLVIPVSTDALKTSSAVVKGMGQDTDLCLGEGNKTSLEKGIREHLKLSSF
jgi:hypothetical protein